MKLEKLDREGIDKFLEKLVSENNFSKYQFYNMAYRENERITKENEIQGKRNDVSEVTLISEDIAIIKFGYEPHDAITHMAYVNNKLVMDSATYTFDEALLLAIMKKYKCSDGFRFVAKALGMKVGEE